MSFSKMTRQQNKSHGQNFTLKGFDRLIGYAFEITQGPAETRRCNL